MKTILTAVAVYISTSIDYLFILLIIYASIGKNRFKDVLGGQYLGTLVLVLISLVAAYLLHFIPEEWIIGLLGFIPIFLGIRYLIYGEEENEVDEVIEKLNQPQNSLLTSVALITLAAGGDNLGIYIPYFTALPFSQIALVILVFTILTFLLNYLTSKISSIDMVSETIEKVEKWIIPITFILLGLYILIENGTIQHFIG